MNRNGSKQMYDRACNLIPGGVNSPVRAFRSVGGTPVYFSTASGSRFTDVDGNEYVDFCQSWGPLILGHARPEVVQAARDAAGRGLSYGACHPAELELAELVLAAFPGFDRVRAVSSGTEAVMTALRIARGATGGRIRLGLMNRTSIFHPPGNKCSPFSQQVTDRIFLVPRNIRL